MQRSNDTTIPPSYHPIILPFYLCLSPGNSATGNWHKSRHNLPRRLLQPWRYRRISGKRRGYRGRRGVAAQNRMF